MKRRTFIKNTGAAGLFTLIRPSGIAQFITQDPGSTLEQDFMSPPTAALPGTIWFWMNGNVTKEGITLDLEAMKRVGIGAVFNFDVGTGIPKGPVKYLSEEWIALKKHALSEAERLGLEFCMHNCPGWSSSGGPWITPELAMQQITWSETYIAGGEQVSIGLSKPANRLNYYRDIAVVAFPSLENEHLLQTVQYSSGNGPVDKKLLTGKDPKGAVVYPDDDHKAWLQLEFAEPYEARLITFYISALPAESSPKKPVEFGEVTAVVLEASNDGENFHAVTTINTGLETELQISDKFIVFDIPVTKAKFYRLTSSETRRYKEVQLTGITRLKNWMEKTNHRARTLAFVADASTIQSTNNQEVPIGSVIQLNGVTDISQYLDKDGILNWQAPAGNWTILRIGFTAEGVLNRAAPETGVGLECDKYNPDAITFHFNRMMEHLLPTTEPLAAKKRMGLEIDSYEAGTQNWTPGFEQAFLKRWGYDIVKYLPVLAGGRIIDSVDKTEGFLWDLRRLQADMIAENYYGRFRALCREHNITTYIEPYEAGPFEEMQIGSKSDVNMGEFWSGVPTVFPAKTPVLRTPKLAASIAHINAQKIVGAEAFTSDPDSGSWQQYPFSLKALGDKMFTKGVNRFIIHRFAHQPHPSAVPGMTMGPYGIHFDRTTTWWNQAKAWLTYLARCQSMLQSGRFVADLVYFTGEDANMYTKVNPDELHPAPPEGYDYDLINAETIFKQVIIVNNEIVLRNGMTYRILVLQDFKAVSLALLRKLHQLVQDGMILVGARPERLAGLADASEGDAVFTQIVNELWPESHSNMEYQLGKGRVYRGQSLPSLLQKHNIEPAFEYTSRSGDAPVIYMYRKIGDADIYFVSNQRRTYEEVVCTFRVKNKQPELWDAATGNSTPVAIYELVNDRVRMPLQLAPYASVLVVFRKPAAQPQWHSVQKDNETVLGTKNFPAVTPSLNKEAANNFTIVFWARPEIKILLNPVFEMTTITPLWTDYYAIYPQPGKELYGEGYATCGVTVGRNGIAVWENATGIPRFVLAAPVAIAGWSHIAIKYENGIPAVYMSGRLIQQGKKSGYLVQPVIDKICLKKEASWYNGDMTQPVLYPEPLNENRITTLASGKPPLQASPFVVQVTGDKKPALLITQNGRYTLRNNTGKTSAFTVSNIHTPVEIKGPWHVYFPGGLGAPAHIVLPELISLHRHIDDGVKYFSGTATYSTSFTLPQKSLAGKRWLLNAGSVEVIAEVIVNGRNFGILWKRPYEVDIAGALLEGTNRLQIKVTNLWPNRLIGDEQFPEPDKFTPGAGASGREGLMGGYIEQLPEWYVKGRPKPDNKRITFTTWKHFTKDSPLLESGLIGPVKLIQAVIKPL